jgi:hypothetical protein
MPGADSRIIQYIRDQLASGFSEQQIRDALTRQGWYPEEINEAFSMAKASAPAQAAQPVSKEAKPSPVQAGVAQKPLRQIGTSFVLTITGGAIILLNSILVYLEFGDILTFLVSNISISFMNMFDIALSTFDSFLINIIIGGFLIAAALIIYLLPDNAKITGMFVVALSVITVLIGNGFLIGGVIAIIGGFFSIIKK